MTFCDFIGFGDLRLLSVCFDLKFVCFGDSGFCGFGDFGLTVVFGLV